MEGMSSSVIPKMVADALDNWMPVILTHVLHGGVDEWWLTIGTREEPFLIAGLDGEAIAEQSGNPKPGTLEGVRIWRVTAVPTLLEL